MALGWPTSLESLMLVVTQLSVVIASGCSWFSSGGGAWGSLLVLPWSLLMVRSTVHSVSLCSCASVFGLILEMMIVIILLVALAQVSGHADFLLLVCLTASGELGLGSSS